MKSAMASVGMLTVRSDTQVQVGSDSSDSLTMVKQRGAVRLLGTSTFLLLTTQRIAIPVGSFSIPVAVPLMFTLFGWGLWHGYLRIDTRRTIAYLASLSLLVTSALVVALSQSFSLASLIFLAGIYALLVITSIPCDVTSIYQSHQRILLAFALIGVVQFAVQVVGAPFIDPVGATPESFILPGYNTVQPLYYGATLIKPNAIVFLEASHLSKAIALAILIELFYFRRWTYLAVFCACYGFTFSGTGLITLTAGMVTGVRYLKTKTLAVFLGFCLCVAAIVAASGFGNVWLNRTAEFGTVNSSGRARFVEPYLRLATVLRDDFAYFGRGPGSVEESFTSVGGVEAFDSTMVKLVFEYGPVAAAVFAGFMLLCLYSSDAPRPLQHACAVVLFFLTGGLLEAVTLYYVFLVAGVAIESDALAPPVIGQGVVASGGSS